VNAALDGVRVLVVEDEYLVAALIEEVLQSAGCIVSGPISRLAEAMNAAGREACEIAVLDVNLAGERVFPVAEILSQRDIPFLFLTGYTTGVVPREYADRPRVCKPFRMADLLGALSSLLTPPMSNSAQPV
jgi:DNA-binding response OmpR family regulator